VLRGSELLQGAVDCHVHACPHINPRSVNVLDATRQAAAAGMKGLGLMDNFGNSSGLAALAMEELGQLGIDVFGGIILEPPAGGIDVEIVRIALEYGYGQYGGARFVSLPTHHTQNIARSEKRSPAYIDSCFAVPSVGDLPDRLLELFDLIAQREVVLNTGHVAPAEALRLVEAARIRGVTRILVPCDHYSPSEVRQITDAGALAEFSFFCLSHATQIPLTNVDAEAHRAVPVTLEQLLERIQAASPKRTVLSTDSGSAVLPPPVESLREYLLLLQMAGISSGDLQQMSSTNPATLFMRK
jgi:Family of unknown function (DUF6282)